MRPRSSTGISTITSRSRFVWGMVLAVAGTAALVAGFMPVRDDITPLSKGFGFLVLVVVVVAIGGLWPGIVASVLGFLSFNYFFLPPYDTFSIGRAEYVVVLFVFLGISVFLSVLVARATSRAEAAERTASELRLQQDLTSALVEPRPGKEGYRTVLQLVSTTFGYGGVILFGQAPNGGLDEVVRVGAEAEGGTETTERLPLTVGRRSLGLLVLEGDRPPLDPAERRILDSFSNQLALLLERDRALRAAIVSQRPA